MAEEKESVLQTDEGENNRHSEGTDIELSDDQIWEEVGADPQSKPSQQTEEIIEATPTSSEQEEDGEITESVTESSETFEIEAHSDEEQTEEEKKAQHDYEKRYKDLEKEFHRRNEEGKELREQFQQFRIEKLELERQLERLQKDKQDTPSKAEEKAEPDPLDPNWFDPETKQTLDDFSELTSAYKKLIAHEVAKTLGKSGEAGSNNEQTAEKIAELEKVTRDYQKKQYWQRHAAEMSSAIGSDFLEIDLSDEFATFVKASPIRIAMMNESIAWEDHIAVMKDFLDTPVGRAKFRPPSDSNDETKPSSDKQEQGSMKTNTNKPNVRRQAAQGLLKNSSPRQERRPEDMSDDELWESIAM